MPSAGSNLALLYCGLAKLPFALAAPFAAESCCEAAPKPEIPFWLGLPVFHLPTCSPQPRKSLWVRRVLRSYNHNLAAKAWSQGMRPKCKQTLHMVRLSGVLEKRKPGRFLIKSQGSTRENCTPERTLCELPNQTQVSTISLVLGQKDRSQRESLPHRVKRGTKSFTERSRGMTRAGPVDHVAAKKICPQCPPLVFAERVGKPFSQEIQNKALSS